MRRTFTLVPSMIALIVVALLARSAGGGVSFAGEAHAALAAAEVRAHATVDRADGRATEPDGRARTLFLHAQGPSTGRVHVSNTTSGDGARSTAALGVTRATFDLVTRRAPGDVVHARQDGVASPGQPAPSSRAPPIG